MTVTDPTPVIPALGSGLRPAQGQAPAGTQGDDHYESDPPPFCQRRNAHCYDDLCADYGCALKAGMEPDRDDGYISIDELVPALPKVRRKVRRTP
jgi:hypothetical protein